MDADAVVAEIPADVLELRKIIGLIDLKAEILTA
jgi:hypothetical protein